MATPTTQEMQSQTACNWPFRSTMPSSSWFSACDSSMKRYWDSTNCVSNTRVMSPKLTSHGIAISGLLAVQDLENLALKRRIGRQRYPGF
ncbi:MAG: hypothetical protein M9944_13570 [Rhizobiaceae bacterium]|nr:hypothetical protein [Rhizobiaceae bacterium]